MSRTISPEGLALIKGFEGFRASPVEMPEGGAWMVGYGHVRIGEAGPDVSEEEASELLRLDLGPVERSVAINTYQALSQAQFDALCSFAFSIGTEAFEKSAVLRRLNAGKMVAAACAMDAWRKSDAGGEMEIIEALIRRRAAEKAMFLCGTPCEAAPSAFVRAKLDYAAAVLGAPVDHKPAPDVTKVVRITPKKNDGERLTEILKSEPATEALLTAIVVEDHGDVEDGEIITAHAKPVARETGRAIAQVRRNLIAAPRMDMPKFKMPLLGAPKSEKKAPRFKLSFPKLERPVEAASLGALFMFGCALVTLSATAVVGGRIDMMDMLGASALAAPGLFAMFLAAYGLMKGPTPKAA